MAYVRGNDMYRVDLAARTERGGTLDVSEFVALEPALRLQLDLRQVGAERYQAALVRPRDFKPGVKLPVIVQAYCGPTVTVVHQSLAQNLLAQWIADHGFLVVKFDGRGTPLRDRAW
ncbi:alpha/beta hydrolase family protein [Corallococcus sp. Z5C101001]|uniref:alpha/beta hydrolase family protein n=1 Tax=Corallococcus sp. Z5C101001 TaxID=2596829 RepID=UPI00351A3291